MNALMPKTIQRQGEQSPLFRIAADAEKKTAFQALINSLDRCIRFSTFHEIAEQI